MEIQVIKDTTSLCKAITKFAIAMRKGGDNAHALAVSCVYQAIEYGNATPARNLISESGPALDLVSLMKWFKANGIRIAWDKAAKDYEGTIDKKAMEKVREEYKKDPDAFIRKLSLNPFYKIGERNAKAFDGYSVPDKLRGILREVEKIMKGEGDRDPNHEKNDFRLVATIKRELEAISKGNAPATPAAAPLMISAPAVASSVSTH